MATKGKGTAEDHLSGKRRRDGDRKTLFSSNFLLFDSSDEEDSTNGVLLSDDFVPDHKVNAEPKTPSIPPFPKKEEIDEEAIEKFLEEHYKPFRSKYGGVSVGSWARVKRGKYMGDLAQVVNVNEFQRKATVKLLPRLDLEAVAKKLSGGGGVSGNKYTSPAPRLITSSELDAYRSRVRHSLDPDTGDLYEVFDGMKLKDGYVFKKFALDSLAFPNCNPSEAELIKFSLNPDPDKNQESNDDVNKEVTVNMDDDDDDDDDNVGDMENSFEVPDLVIHGRKAFGREKDDHIEGGISDLSGHGTDERLLKKAKYNKKYNALDHHKKIISMNDTVRVLKGPLKGKQGIVKQIYKKMLFLVLHDDNLHENCGYFHAKAKMCEKMEVSTHPFKGKGQGGKSDASGLGGQSVGCSEPEPPPAAVGFEGVSEGSFAEKLRSGAQELGGLMEEAAARCLGRVTLEDQLRDALVDLESFKERVSAVEAERDTFHNSLKQEREKIVSVFRKLLDTDFQLVIRLTEDLRIWCERYEGDV